MRYFFLIFSVWLSLLAAGCDSAVSDAEILVSGKGLQIKAGEFRPYLQRAYQNAPRKPYRISRQFSQKKKYFLEQWLTHQLFLKEAQQRFPEVGENSLALEQEMQKFKEKYPDNYFAKTLKDRNLLEIDWQKTQKEKWLVRHYLIAELQNVPEPTEQELKAFYQKNLKQYQEKSRVHIRHILLNKKEKADQVMRRLKRGANFAKLARDFSIAPERKQGGDLGWIQRGEYPREFAVCFAMNPGEISPLIPSAYGFHIFKIIEKKPSRQLAFEEVKNKIKISLRKEQAAKMQIKLLKELYQKYQIEIKEDVLERIDL